MGVDLAIHPIFDASKTSHKNGELMQDGKHDLVLTTLKTFPHIEHPLRNHGLVGNLPHNWDHKLGCLIFLSDGITPIAIQL